MTEREINEQQINTIRDNLKDLADSMSYPCGNSAGCFRFALTGRRCGLEGCQEMKRTERNYFDLKHNNHPPSGREDAYSTLADWEHNSIPMHEFCRDYIYDNDQQMYKLIVDCLKAEFSHYGPDDRALGERLRQIVTEGFDDHTAGE